MHMHTKLKCGFLKLTQKLAMTLVVTFLMLTSINPVSVEAKQKLKATPTDKVSDAPTLDDYKTVVLVDENGKLSTKNTGRV